MADGDKIQLKEWQMTTKFNLRARMYSKNRHACNFSCILPLKLIFPSVIH